MLSVLKCWKNSFALGQLLCKLVRQELILWCLLTLSPFSGDKNGFRPYTENRYVFFTVCSDFSNTPGHIIFLILFFHWSYISTAVLFICTDSYMVSSSDYTIIIDVENRMKKITAWVIFLHTCGHKHITQ